MVRRKSIHDYPAWIALLIVLLMVNTDVGSLGVGALIFAWYCACLERRLYQGSEGDDSRRARHRPTTVAGR